MSRTSRYESKSSFIWKAGAYIRLSREDEELKSTGSQSVISQKKIIEKFLNNHSDLQLIDFYIDDGFTGTDLDRPGFNSLKTAYENGTINCILVKDLSRLARNNEYCDKLLKVIFPFYKIRFISVNDRIDSYLYPDSIYRIDTSFKNIMNDEYSKDLSKKIRSAQAVLRAEGKFIGAFAPYGYKKDQLNRHKLIIDEEAAKVIKFIFDAYLDGQNFSIIAQKLIDENVPSPLFHMHNIGSSLKVPHVMSDITWSSSIIKRILSSYVYIGCLVQGKSEVISYKNRKKVKRDKNQWIISENAHEPIIDKKLFYKVQDKLIEHKVVKKKAHQSMFGGLIKCGNCGYSMSITKYLGKNKYRAYFCNSRYKRKTNCDNFHIRECDLNIIVLEILNKHLALFIETKKAFDKIKINRQYNSEFSAKASVIDLEIKNLYIALKDRKLNETEYIRRRSELKLERAKISNDQIVSVDETLKEQFERSTFYNIFSSTNKFENLTKELVKATIESINVFSPDKIEIVLKFKDEFANYVSKLSLTEC